MPTLHAYVVNVTNWWGVIWQTMKTLQCQRVACNHRSVAAVPLVLPGTGTMRFPLHHRQNAELRCLPPREGGLARRELYSGGAKFTALALYDVATRKTARH